MQVGAYVIARGIQDEPAFAWWVPYVMRKRDIIVSMVKSRVRRTTHKYAMAPNETQLVMQATLCNYVVGT